MNPGILQYFVCTAYTATQTFSYRTYSVAYHMAKSETLLAEGYYTVHMIYQYFNHRFLDRRCAALHHNDHVIREVRIGSSSTNLGNYSGMDAPISTSAHCGILPAGFEPASQDPKSCIITTRQREYNGSSFLTL